MRDKTSYEEILKIASDRGGILLTTQEEYDQINTTLSLTKFLWQCNMGHIPFNKRLAYAKRGSWCPICSEKRKWTYERLIKLAEERGLERNDLPGKILTSYDEFKESKKTQYPNNTKYRWTCQIKRHEPWYAGPDSIKSGTWCPTCAKNQRKSYEDMKHLAFNRGIEENGKPGKFLITEEEYNEFEGTPSLIHFMWQCGEGHKPWYSTATNIQQGRWCPKCSEGKWERIVRFYFESIFRTKFHKKKPKWLRDLTGHRLELDGYNERLKLAFELNGPQHYYPIYGIEKLVIQQEFDDMRRKACNKRNITLIEIPYNFDGLNDSIDEEKLQKFIIKNFEQLSRKKLPPMPNFNYKTRNFKRLDTF